MGPASQSRYAVEAAAVDRGSLTRTPRDIVASVVMPGLASAALIGFTFSWNELLLVQGPSMGAVK
jgi:sorbitol/mannitol transport system permease protein